MAERLCVNRKAKLKSKSVALSPEGFALFGEPQLLEGENVEAYHELLTRIRAAIKPVDIIDYMFIADIVALEWEVLRWRRMKTSLVRALGLAALEEFLAEKLDYNLCLDRFTDSLTEILQENHLSIHLPQGNRAAFAPERGFPRTQECRSSRLGCARQLSGSYAKSIPLQIDMQDLELVVELVSADSGQRRPSPFHK